MQQSAPYYNVALFCLHVIQFTLFIEDYKVLRQPGRLNTCIEGAAGDAAGVCRLRNAISQIHSYEALHYLVYRRHEQLVIPSNFSVLRPHGRI